MNRCDNCCEILDINYCDVCDGGNEKVDQIHVPEYLLEKWIAKDYYLLNEEE